MTPKQINDLREKLETSGDPHLQKLGVVLSDDQLVRLKALVLGDRG